jgi:hypothetical protein
MKRLVIIMSGIGKKTAAATPRRKYVCRGLRTGSPSELAVIGFRDWPPNVQ